MSEKLKPCPFCGSKNVELRTGMVFNGAVHCNDCTADVVFDAEGSSVFKIENTVRVLAPRSTTGGNTSERPYTVRVFYR